MPVPAQGNVAQQIFWYTAFTADMVEAGPAGGERGRHAEVAHGAVAARLYWKDGMKLGYQDVGSWTLLKSTPDDRAKAAWLYAQFVVVEDGGREEEPCRPDLHPRVDDPAQEPSPSARRSSAAWSSSTARRPASQWSPTGINVPDYPKLAQIWWQQIGDATSGA